MADNVRYTEPETGRLFRATEDATPTLHQHVVPEVLALAHGAAPSPVDAGALVGWAANRHGVPFVIGGHPNVQTIRAQYTDAQSNTAIVSVSAGSKIVVTQVQVTASNANTVSPSVVIGFGTSTTPTGAGVLAAHAGVPGGGGFSRGDGSGILGIGADDEDVRITSDTPASGGAIDVVISYYVVPS